MLTRFLSFNERLFSILNLPLFLNIDSRKREIYFYAFDISKFGCKELLRLAPFFYVDPTIRRE